MTDDNHSQSAAAHWVFGYGSLIHKVDFPYLDREVAAIEGWLRRFWQGSHDHRGTPDASGRVVTLIPSPGAVCRGMAYRVNAGVFAHLDHRGKNGYGKHRISMTQLDSGQVVTGTLYVAGPDNHAFLGPADPEAMAAHIARAHGPSGSNRDYLLNLAAALREIGDEDPHVTDLERRVLAASPGPA